MDVGVTRTDLWQGVLVFCLSIVVIATGVVTGYWLTLPMLPALAVGLLLTRRVPSNATGWWLTFGAAIGTVAWAAGGLTEATELPLDLRVWAGAAGAVLGMTVMATYLGMTPLVFPTGRPFSVVLRTVLIVTWAATVLMQALSPTLCLNADRANCLERVSNPLGVGWMPDVGTSEWVTAMLFMVSLACVLTLIPRYLRAGGVERHQIRWVVAAFAGYVLFLFIPMLVLTEFEIISIPHWVADGAFGLLIILLPITISVAILKYRLYDIDRIINRTVVYAIVVGLLGVVFAAGAVWAPSLLPFEENNLAVAASTLAVFFLFNPLRRRVQRFVDRRFYRSHYDAQQVADDFSARLRDQVDPEVVTEEWVGVVQRTMQPATVAVWVREGS